MSSTAPNHTPDALTRQLELFMELFELDLDEVVTIDSSDEAALGLAPAPVAIYNYLFPNYRIPLMRHNCPTAPPTRTNVAHEKSTTTGAAAAVTFTPRQRLPPNQDPSLKDSTFSEYAQQSVAVRRKIPATVIRTDTKDMVALTVYDADELQSIRPILGDKWHVSAKVSVQNEQCNYKTLIGPFVDESGNRTVIEAQVIRVHPPPIRPSDWVEPLRTTLVHITVLCLDAQQMCALICLGRDTVQTLRGYIAWGWKSSFNLFCLGAICAPSMHFIRLGPTARAGSVVVAERLGPLPMSDPNYRASRYITGSRGAPSPPSIRLLRRKHRAAERNAL